jgi:16S rRNA (cytosine1402-N4)-methyltransferase
MSASRHLPVLVEESLEALAPERGGLFVDCTLGMGGHAAALLDRSPTARLLGIDRDPEALERARRRLARHAARVELAEAPFSRLAEVLGSRRVDGGIFADLGVSSWQLDEARRGFSFQQEGPLDMRMGAAGRTAAEVVNEDSEEELTRIMREYGEERMARRIAREIVRRRADRPLRTTAELAATIHEAKGRRREGRVDSATRVFQALRIEVNQELAELQRLLEQATRLLDQDGRLVIISYHSLEDRLVKHHLRRHARGEIDPVTGRPKKETQLLELLTRKAVRPAEKETSENPRARSARLRAARRL